MRPTKTSKKLKLTLIFRKRTYTFLLFVSRPDHLHHETSTASLEMEEGVNFPQQPPQIPETLLPSCGYKKNGMSSFLAETANTPNNVERII